MIYRRCMHIVTQINPHSGSIECFFFAEKISNICKYDHIPHPHPIKSDLFAQAQYIQKCTLVELNP